MNEPNETVDPTSPLELPRMKQTLVGLTGALVMIALLTTGYLWWQLDALRRDVMFKQQAVQDSLDTTTRATDTMQNQGKAVQEELRKLLAQQQSLQQGLATLSQAPSPTSLLTPLVTLDYLLQMTEIQINTLGNLATGYALLDIISAQLKALPAEKFKPLLQNVQQLQQQLNNQQQRDANQLVGPLHDLQQSINALPYRTPTFEIDSPKEQPIVKTTSSDSFWREALTKSWQSLSKFIRVEHHERDFQPPLPITEQHAERYLIMTLLQQALVAALQHDADNYHIALQQASDLMADLPQADAIKGIQEKLASLQSVSPALPKVNITALRQQLDQLAQANPADTRSGTKP